MIDYLFGATVGHPFGDTTIDFITELSEGPTFDEPWLTVNTGVETVAVFGVRIVAKRMGATELLLCLFLFSALQFTVN